MPPGLEVLGKAAPPTTFLQQVFIRLVDDNHDNYITQRELLSAQIKAASYAQDFEMDPPSDWPTMLDAIYVGFDRTSLAPLVSHRQVGIILKPTCALVYTTRFLTTFPLTCC